MVARGLRAPGALADAPRSSRPRADGDPALLADVAAALSAVRRAKTEAKVSMRAEVARAVVRGPRTRSSRSGWRARTSPTPVGSRSSTFEADDGPLRGRRDPLSRRSGAGLGTRYRCGRLVPPPQGWWSDADRGRELVPLARPSKEGPVARQPSVAPVPSDGSAARGAPCCPASRCLPGRQARRRRGARARTGAACRRTGTRARARQRGRHGRCRPRGRGRRCGDDRAERTPRPTGRWRLAVRRCDGPARGRPARGRWSGPRCSSPLAPPAQPAVTTRCRSRRAALGRRRQPSPRTAGRSRGRRGRRRVRRLRHTRSRSCPRATRSTLAPTRPATTVTLPATVAGYTTVTTPAGRPRSSGGEDVRPHRRAQRNRLGVRARSHHVTVAAEAVAGDAGSSAWQKAYAARRDVRAVGHGEARAADGVAAAPCGFAGPQVAGAITVPGLTPAQAAKLLPAFVAAAVRH